MLGIGRDARLHLSMPNPEPPKIGPRKSRTNTRVCPGCGCPKRLGAHWCKRCGTLGPPGNAPTATGLDPNVRPCTGPGKYPFSKECVGNGALEPGATRRTRRCSACRKLLRQEAERRATSRKPRPGPEAVANETLWTRAFQDKLQQLQAGRASHEDGPRYTTVKEEQHGRTAYITKVDMRARRGAARRG